MYVMSVQHFACMHSDFDMILSYLKAHNFKVLIFFLFRYRCPTNFLPRWTQNSLGIGVQSLRTCLKLMTLSNGAIIMQAK